MYKASKGGKERENNDGEKKKRRKQMQIDKNYIKDSKKRCNFSFEVQQKGEERMWEKRNHTIKGDRCREEEEEEEAEAEAEEEEEEEERKRR